MDKVFSKGKYGDFSNLHELELFLRSSGDLVVGEGETVDKKPKLCISTSNHFYEIVMNNANEYVITVKNN